MTNYPLKVVLWVRKMAEDKALHLVQVARAEEQKAREEAAVKEKALADYVDWCAKEEDRLYGEIQGKAVPHKRILFVRDQVAWNAGQQQKYERQVEEARAEVRLKEGAVKQAVEHYQAMAREVFKLEQHREEWTNEAKKVAENIEENEIEEAGELIQTYRRMNS